MDFFFFFISPHSLELDLSGWGPSHCSPATDNGGKRQKKERKEKQQISIQCSQIFTKCLKSVTCQVSNDWVYKVNNCLFKLCYFRLVLCFCSEQVTHQYSGPSAQICLIQKMALASHLHGTQSGGSQTPGGSRQDMIRIVNKDTQPAVETPFVYLPLI